MSRLVSHGEGLVGRDFARYAESQRRLIPAGLIVGLLVAALLLTALRVDIIHLGYALGEAVKQENALQEERRVLSAQLEALRNPEHLGKLAAQQGFGRAENVLQLTPAPGGENEWRTP